MACKNRAKVYLGYDDGFIEDKHRSLVNFTTNKIGGQPDLYDTELSLPKPICKRCGRKQLMVLQLYAPLEHSRYHRTLYLFACIAQECFNKNNTWTCLRVQALDEKSTNVTESIAATNIPTQPTTSWLSSSDDWGDDGNDNVAEQNGNDVFNDTRKLHLYMKASDIDRELNKNLSSLNLNDQNINGPMSMESPVGGGAAGRLDSPQASAEIEGEESEVVSIDTPTKPQNNLRYYLQGSSCHPFQHLDELHLSFEPTFVELFIAVEEEDLSLDVPQHVRDLFLEYQLCNPDISDTHMDSPSDQSKSIETSPEKYEKSIPKHGDEMFHHLISRIQKNPGQLLRYCRDNSAPLPINPIGSSTGSCEYCGDERIFEVQILPTMIQKLEVQPENDYIFEMEFGTILVFTCSSSCWSINDSYREEFVIAQAEKFE